MTILIKFIIKKTQFKKTNLVVNLNYQEYENNEIKFGLLFGIVVKSEKVQCVCLQINLNTKLNH